MLSKREISNFKLLVTLSSRGIFYFRKIRKRIKESVLLIHPIGYDLRRQNKSMRNEELMSRKAEHLSTTNTNADRGILIFSVQLATSRIGNLTRLIHTLAICVTIHTYIRPE